MTSRSYLDNIRNPQPYGTPSEASNPPSRARTPTSLSGYANTPSRPYSRGGGQSNPPSRPRTPASILDLTNPKPYPKPDDAYNNAVVKPTAVKASPQKPAKSYKNRDLDKPRAKRYTKTKTASRASNHTTPAASDVESRTRSQGGSISSLDLNLQVADQDPFQTNSFTLNELDAEPVRPGSAHELHAAPTRPVGLEDPGPEPAPRTTSLTNFAAPRTSLSGPGATDLDSIRLSDLNGVTLPSNHHEAAAEALGGTTVIDTTRSYNNYPTLTAEEKREKLLKAALVFLLVVFFFSLGLGLGIGGSASRYPPGAFSMTLGESCRFSCRNKNSYSNRNSYPLIVFAIDGLPKYLPEGVATNIQRMSECGVHSHEMIPAFASTTYPNLWSIITGRYPESHGVYSDYMEGSIGRVFEPRVSQNNLDENEWYKAKPLWQTAREQGVVSGSHSWLGNNMGDGENDEGQVINGKPNYYQPYNSALTPQDMIGTVGQWLMQDDVTKIPQFITVFFDGPGRMVREYGMHSQQANDSLLEVDHAIGGLLDILLENQDVMCFNFMVMATSGLVPTTCGSNNNENVAFLESGVNNLAGLETTPDYLNSFARITISSGAADSLNTPEKLSNFIKCKSQYSEASVYSRDEMPSRYHYSSASGIPDGVYVLMNDGKSFARQLSGYDQQSCQYASDGYDPTGVDSMASFIGFGQSFKMNHVVSEFNVIDLYNLMSDLLGITPEPNNGSMGALNSMLKSPGTFPMSTMQFGGETFCPYDVNRVMADYKTGCECPNAQGDSTAQQRGNAVFSATSGSDERHIPFGPPSILESASPDSSDNCKLYQNSYVLSYNKALTIGRYVSLTLDAGFSLVSMPTGCILTDTRLMIGENPKCTAFSSLPGIKRSFLLQPRLSLGVPDAGIISSNLAPLYQDFETGIWTPLIEKYRSWADLPTSFDINIVQGPVYDANHDGLADDGAIIAMSSLWAGNTPVPTHYFVVATRCINNTAVASCLPEDIQSLAFILPHNNLGLPCTSTLDEYMLDHRATIQDVESITGLCFFPNWSLSDDVMIRRPITLMKSYLPNMMWTN